MREIKGACAARCIGAKMTIGAVRSLQGAERPIIIFSPVYTKHADGHFIDMSPSLLKVTVSRARDSFRVLGEMGVFSSAAKGPPCAVLAEMLFSPTDSTLEFGARPRSDLQYSDCLLTTLLDAKEHNGPLSDTLSLASTTKRVGLLDAFKKATARGAEVDAFVDPLPGQSRSDDGPTQLDAAMAALSKIGVRMHQVRQLHSKIAIVDKNQLRIG